MNTIFNSYSFFGCDVFMKGVNKFVRVWLTSAGTSFELSENQIRIPLKNWESWRLPALSKSDKASAADGQLQSSSSLSSLIR